jgi:S-adenosylmethionine decarboxylase proenzyme
MKNSQRQDHLKMKKSLGRHMLLELYDCPQEILNNQEKIEEVLVGVVHAVGATLINTSFHKFSPYGVSGVVVIAESHITIHTWPEHNYAAIDVFTCNDKIDYALVENIVVKKFSSSKHKAQTIIRGEI